jgi:hypothetical protein
MLLQRQALAIAVAAIGGSGVSGAQVEVLAVIPRIDPPIAPTIPATNK